MASNSEFEQRGFFEKSKEQCCNELLKDIKNKNKAAFQKMFYNTVLGIDIKYYMKMESDGIPKLVVI